MYNYGPNYNYVPNNYIIQLIMYNYGPNYNYVPMLFDILLHFRTYPVALNGDIERAFLMIRIAEEDRCFTISMASRSF